MTTLRAAALALCLGAVAACNSGTARTAADATAQPNTSVHAGTGHAAAEAQPAASALVAVVYKTPTCGCCAKWVDHLRAGGFQVEVHDVEQVEPIKRQWGVPGNLGSCHTAKIGGYAFEGHVPVDVIQRVLREKPQIVGVAVPGMPMGSPGMEGPYKDRYDVVAFDASGNQRVYETR
jgi:hypothetical protein